MRITSSSFVLATLALSPALAAPTPTMPYDSPVPNSPRFDDWTESVRSPRIPRSPMLPAIRVAGRRRSIPHFRRQEGGAPPPAEDADTASAQGLLGGLGDTLSGILHSVGDVAAGLPIIGGLGILSTDSGSDPGSSPPQKRDDAETASAEGLLGTLGDTLDGVLHQVGDVANSLPIIGGLGILSTDDSPPQKRDDAAPTSTLAPTSTPDADATPADPDATPAPDAGTTPDADTPPAEPDTVAASHLGRRTCIPHLRRQEDGAPPAEDADTASTQGLLGGLGDTLSGILHQVGDVAAGLPIIGGLGILSTDGSDPGASPQKRDGSPMPVDQLNALRQQVATLLLQQQQAEQAAATLSAASSSLPANPADLQQRLLALQNTVQGVSGLNLQSLLGGLPIAGGVISNTLSNGPLSTVGGIAGGLPVVGGILSTVGGVAGGLPVVGGVLGGGGGGQLPLGGVVNSVTGAATGVLGGVAGDNGIFQNVLGGGGSAASQAFASTEQMQWPDATGLYPHTLVNGAPVAPPNSPASLPSSIVYGALGMGGSGGSLPAPPPSPASSAASVPMDHDSASSLIGSAAAITSTIPAPSAVPSVALEDPLRRRRVDGDVVAKRSDAHGTTESDMHEGGPDAVSGPQDRLSGTLKAPRQLKMFRRLLRGASVSF